MNAERILIVDDEPRMLRTVERLLAHEFPVKTASSGRQALELAREEAPDLAILDVRMPEMDGFELMGALRELHPGVDVIFMTGALEELDRQLLRAIRERAFYFVQKPFDREVLLTLVDRCLEQRRLERVNRAHVDRLEKELDDARSFQQSLLPPSQAQVGRLEIATYCKPCDELGGDLVDFVDAGDDGLAFLVADVSGHGVTAAMLTAVVKSAFHDTHDEGYHPSAVLERLMRGIKPFGYDRFVTLFCGRVDAAAGELEYVNAGHPNALLWGPRRERIELETTGPMVSPAFDAAWESGRIELGSGDRLLAYTDGVVEARGPGEMFGEERLHALLSSSDSAGKELLGTLLDAVRDFARGRPVDDDLTLMTWTVR